MSQASPYTHYLIAVETNTAWSQTDFYTACSLERKRDKVFYTCSGNVTWEPWDMSTRPADVTCPRCKKTARYKDTIGGSDE
jgi:hypothetical protein